MNAETEKERYSGSAADSLERGSTTLASGARDGFLQADVTPTAARVTPTRPSPPECKGMRESRGHGWGAGQASCSLEHVAEPKLKQEVPKVGSNGGEDGDSELSTLVPGSL